MGVGGRATLREKKIRLRREISKGLSQEVMFLLFSKDKYKAAEERKAISDSANSICKGLDSMFGILGEL